MTFRYALNSSTIRPVPILEKIAVAADTGYEGIELWHDDIDAHIAAGGTIDDIRRALQTAGLAVPTSIYVKDWFDTTGEKHQAALAECRRRFEQAAAVGAPHVIAGPPGGAADPQLGARNYHELLEIGEEYGVRPAMEFLGFVDQYNTIESALEVMQLSGDPQATIVIDPFHIFRGGGSLESLARLRPEHIAVSHFNDTPAHPPREQQHDRDRVQPGDGHLDLHRYVQLLRKIGYYGWLSLELFNEDLWKQDPRQVARDGLQKMRAIAESA